MLLQYRIVAYYSNIFNNKCITINNKIVRMQLNINDIHNSLKKV